MFKKNNLLPVFIIFFSSFVNFTTLKSIEGSLHNQLQQALRLKKVASTQQNQRRVTKYISAHPTNTGLFQKLQAEFATTNIDINVKSSTKFDYSVKFNNYDVYGTKNTGSQFKSKQNAQTTGISVGSSQMKYLKAKLDVPNAKWYGLTFHSHSNLNYLNMNPSSINYYIKASGSVKSPLVFLFLSYSLRSDSHKVINTEMAAFNLPYNHFLNPWGYILIAIMVVLLIALVGFVALAFRYINISDIGEWFRARYNPLKVQNFPEALESGRDTAMKSAISDELGYQGTYDRFADFKESKKESKLEARKDDSMKYARSNEFSYHGGVHVGFSNYIKSLQEVAEDPISLDKPSPSDTKKDVFGDPISPYYEALEDKRLKEDSSSSSSIEDKKIVPTTETSIENQGTWNRIKQNFSDWFWEPTAPEVTVEKEVLPVRPEYGDRIPNMFNSIPDNSLNRYEPVAYSSDESIHTGNDILSENSSWSDDDLSVFSVIEPENEHQIILNPDEVKFGIDVDVINNFEQDAYKIWKDHYKSRVATDVQSLEAKGRINTIVNYALGNGESFPNHLIFPNLILGNRDTIALYVEGFSTIENLLAIERQMENL